MPSLGQAAHFKSSDDTGAGVAACLLAFTVWGVLPIYWKHTAFVNPLEVVCHRGLWSLACLLPIMLITRRMPEVAAAMRGKNFLLLALSTTLLTVNWLIFIWAIGQNNILETSLGNFMNPLFNMLCGVVFFRDRITRWQWASVFLLVVSVLVRVSTLGHFPWVALSLCLTFSGYGMIRKIVAVEAGPALLVESLILAPVAAGLLFYLHGAGGLSFGASLPVNLLLMFAGPVTCVPMFFFAFGARRVRLTTLGVMHYIVPTLSFILGVFVYRETFTYLHGITFAIIWLALVIYTVEKLRGLHGLHAPGTQAGK